MILKIPGKSFFLAFFLFLLTVSSVRAEVHIFEIHVFEDDGVMAIYGTMFGEDPVIRMGT